MGPSRTVAAVVVTLAVLTALSELSGPRAESVVGAVVGAGAGAGAGTSAPRDDVSLRGSYAIGYQPTPS